MFSASGSFGSVAGWTMIHLLWVVALIYLLHLLTQFLLRRFSDHVRYCAACAMLGVVVMVSGFLIYLPHALDRDWPVGGTIRELARHVGLDPVDTEQRDRWRAPHWFAYGNVVDRSSVRQFAMAIEPALSWAGVVWILGMLIRLAQPTVGTLSLRWLVRRASKANVDLADPLFVKIQSIVPGRVIPVLSTQDVGGPCTTGWWKPVILMPAGLLLQLAPYQLECILAHELAHIRRRDFLINVMQISVEAALFFHPCVWLISRRIRILREACCDDLAIAAVGSAKTYGATLLFVAQWRPDDAKGHEEAPATALAMSDTSVPQRVKRLVQLKYQPARQGYGRFAGAVAGVMMLLLIAFAPLSSVAEDYRQQERFAGSGLSHLVLEEWGLLADNPSLWPALKQLSVSGRRGTPSPVSKISDWAIDDLALLVGVASRGALPDQVMRVRLHALRLEAGRSYDDPELNRPGELFISSLGRTIFNHALSFPAGDERLRWVRAALVLAAQQGCMVDTNACISYIVTHKRFEEVSELPRVTIVRFRRYASMYFAMSNPLTLPMLRMIRESPGEIPGFLRQYPLVNDKRYYAVAGIAAVTDRDDPVRQETIAVLLATDRPLDRKLAELLQQPLRGHQAYLGMSDPVTKLPIPPPSPRWTVADPATVTAQPASTQ